MKKLKTHQQQELHRGDHIKVKRKGYIHHGIYCGDNTVIHYTDANQNKWSASICEDSLQTFQSDGNIQVVSYKHPYPASFVIKRAKSRLGERDYNLFFNNCEHFSAWCKTGQAKSVQANLAMRAATKLLLKQPIIYVVAEGIQIIGELTLPKEHPHYEFLPFDVLLLFQVFKQAYERRSIEVLSNTISESFTSNVYGGMKSRFLQIMKTNFDYFTCGLKPSLTINIHDIVKDTPDEFQVIIDMHANMNMLGALNIPFTQYDSGRILCVVRPENKDWRIVELRMVQEGKERQVLAAQYAHLARRFRK